MHICKQVTSSNHTCFEIGSSSEIVRAVQGTPTSISRYSTGEVWWYGISNVEFRNGKVYEYSNASNTLHICDKVIFNRDIKNTSSITSADILEFSGSPKAGTYNVGFKPFLGTATTVVNMRIEPNTSSTVIRILDESSLLYVYSENSINDFYKVIDVESSNIGWVHKSYVQYMDKVEFSDNDGFISRGTIAGDNAEVVITNKSDYFVKLIVGDDLFQLKPNSTQTVNVQPGMNNFIATAPKVIPSSGRKLFERGHGYEWEFWVVRTRR